MNRILGILLIVIALYGLVRASNPNAESLQNHQQLAERVAKYGILTLGAGVLILSGGIDLSIGSVVALSAVGLGVLLNLGAPWPLAVLAVLAGAVLIGLFHGFLVTRLGLQPFIVTLCGLFIYRGMALWLALPDPMAPVRGLLRFLSFGALFANASIETGSAGNVGIGALVPELRGLIDLATGYPEISGPLAFLSYVPMQFWLLLLIAGLLTVLLHFSVYGRYLYAVGSNEQAARYAGIPTARYKVLAYVICSVLAAVAGMQEMLELPSASPSSTGSYYELYAITGAVLGGCSLRGGEGTVIGMLLGTAVLPLLRNFINMSGIKGDLEFMVIGFALLLGTIGDELLKRRARK